MRLKLLILLTVIFLSIGDIGEINATYRSLVDGYNGFYRVINTTTGESISDQNHILNINVGDNIIWINEDQSDRITIISDQGLWESDVALLEHTGSQFNYTFDSPGIYTFNIKEYKGFSKQTVTVSDISYSNDTDMNATPNPTITPTETIITPTETVNITNNENMISINPILMPLNILSNMKMIGFMAFIIAMIIFFIKD